jgi:hypothetical protein
MKKLLLVFCCLCCCKTSFPQLIQSKINDTTIILEDTTDKSKALVNQTYELHITFAGAFSKDSISILFNDSMLFSGVMTTMSASDTSLEPLNDSLRLFQRINPRRKNSLIFFINGTPIKVPIKDGYPSLNVYLFSPRVRKESGFTYGFEFTNSALPGI